MPGQAWACKRCKAAYQPSPDDVPPDFPQPWPEKIYKPVGCRDCRETGYAGRTGIYELLKTDAAIRHMCVERTDSNKIRDYAREHGGMTTLRQSGWDKVAQGITSVEEVLRITKGDVI